MKIKKHFMISCKEATFLVSLKEENKLSAIQYLKLKLHLAICILCRRFEIQTGHFAKLSTHWPIGSEERMSDEKKVHIKKLINQMRD